jgi:hypothetical protein
MHPPHLSPTLIHVHLSCLPLFAPPSTCSHPHPCSPLLSGLIRANPHYSIMLFWPSFGPCSRSLFTPPVRAHSHQPPLLDHICLALVWPSFMLVCTHSFCWSHWGCMYAVCACLYVAFICPLFVLICAATWSCVWPLFTLVCTHLCLFICLPSFGFVHAQSCPFGLWWGSLHALQPSISNANLVHT